MRGVFKIFYILGMAYLGGVSIGVDGMALDIGWTLHRGWHGTGGGGVCHK